MLFVQQGFLRSARNFYIQWGVWGLSAVCDNNPCHVMIAPSAQNILSLRSAVGQRSWLVILYYALRRKKKLNQAIDCGGLRGARDSQNAIQTGKDNNNKLSDECNSFVTKRCVCATWCVKTVKSLLCLYMCVCGCSCCGVYVVYRYSVLSALVMFYFIVYTVVSTDFLFIIGNICLIVEFCHLFWLILVRLLYIYIW